MPTSDQTEITHPQEQSYRRTRG
jgi:hypothetical protein